MYNPLEKAWAFALKFCEENPEWKTINNIPQLETLYKTWGELPEWERSFWKRAHGLNAREAWEALGTKTLKVPHSFVGEDGIHYQDVRVMPSGMNHVMILRIGPSEKHRKGDKNG